VGVLSSRILLRPSDLNRSRRFYRDLLGLAIYREFGLPDDPGLVFFPGQRLLEVAGHAAGPPWSSVIIWIQVCGVHAEYARLAAVGVPGCAGTGGGALGPDRDVGPGPDASGSSWSRFPPVTLSAVTRDRRDRRNDEPPAA
jgi:catechol 2,3-dioxygenase-like lactoylglutathione lyase family enzyme